MADTLKRLKTALADRYAIQEELGAGGMATVYLAEDLKHHRKVAVKVLRPELAAVLGAERFVKEIETTANLQHPHILPLFDSGEADSFLYYVMPFIDGETLRDKLNRETQLGIEEAVKITTEVADALDYAHRNNVIHRDIKPENILLHDGRPMVADFGIALAVSAAAGGRMTETGLSLGTPHYMSPEQATAEKDLTNRSDIYSLGSVLYEMLTGEPPHTGASAQAIVMKIVAEDVQPVTELRKSVPPNVAAALAKSLEKLAADRFGAAKEFADALTNPAFTLPTAQAAAAARAPASGPWKRLSVGLAALAVVLMLIAVWGWLRPEPARPIRRYRLALPAEQALVPALGSRIVLSPDGSRLVFVGPGDPGTQLWVLERDQLDAAPWPGTEGAGLPFFSPDGQRVGFFTDGTTIKVASLPWGPAITVVDSGISGGGATWGADDFIYVGGIGPIKRVPVSGGAAVERVTTLDSAGGEEGHAWPEVLPNGRGVLYTVFRDLQRLGENEIAVLDFATGEHTVLVRGVYARYAASGHLVFVTDDGTLMVAPFDQDGLALTGEAIGLAANVRVRGATSVDLAVSSTGTLVYTAGGSGSEPHQIVWVDRDGTAVAVDSAWVGRFSSLSLSPDETRLAVTAVQRGESQVWVKQLPTGPLTLLSLEGTVNRRPRWTPDGRSVTFVSDRAGVGQSNVYLHRADGSGLAEQLIDHESPIAEAFVTPGGEWLVTRTEWSQARNVLVGFRLPGDNEPVPLVVSRARKLAPSLSPNGRWLAYDSDESGRDEVYVVPFPNTGDARWQVSTTGGIDAIWARDGRSLFYRSTSDRLVEVQVVPGPTFTMGERNVLFSMEDYAAATPTHYDVTRDGRFLMIRRRAADQGFELIVVENWFEELKAKVGN